MYAINNCKYEKQGRTFPSLKGDTAQKSRKDNPHNGKLKKQEFVIL